MDKNPDRTTLVVMDILDAIDSDEAFEIFISNVRMLWAAKIVAKNIARGLPASAAKN